MTTVLVIRKLEDDTNLQPTNSQLSTLNTPFVDKDFTKAKQQTIPRMSGMGAIFELWSEFQGSKNPEEKKEEEVKLEPDPDEAEEGYLDQNSEWHKAIHNRNWDSLLFMLQQFDFQKYKPKPKEKKDRRLRVVKAAHWVKEKVQKPPEEEEPIPVSPLLALDDLGQTPLHAAIANLAPDRLITRLANSERKAALIADKKGHIPLHVATIHERNTQVIDRCIRSNFHHMQQLDEAGRTALWYAVERAVARTEENVFDLDLYWGIPRDQEDREWQERQEVYWEKVKFILLSYSSRRKVMIPEERRVLLESLEHAAPPAVIELCIMACQGMLHTDPSLASGALRIFMRRSYPIKNLQILLYHFPVKKEESLHAARRILTDHYFLGCRTLEGRDMSYREEMERYALVPKFKRSLHTQEWWNKIKCLLRLCGHGNDKDHKKEFEDKSLLHAALSNFDTPPSLVQLLMAMNPEAIKMRHPFLNCLLVHLICRNWKYNLCPHSKAVGVNLEMAEPPMEQVLKIIVTSDPSNVRKRYNNRLPLHHAVATGKSVEFLDALIQKDRKTLGVRDPETKLFPYQMAAFPSLNRNCALWAAAKYGEEEWKALRSKKRAAAVQEVLDEQDLDQLSTIYTLIKEHPAALEPPALVKKLAGIGRKRGCGMISTHFLKLLYQRQPRDGDSVVDESAELNPDIDEWAFLKYNMTFLVLALENKEVPSEIEQWWQKMKFWIRFCYTGDNSLPQDDEHLLHAGLSNPDTPPLMVELLLALHPESASLPVEGKLEYPLHIAAATSSYVPQYFENYESKNVYQLLIDAYPKAASMKSAAGLPIDIARKAGKNDNEIAPLLKASLRSSRSSRTLGREKSSRTSGRSSLNREKSSRSSLKTEKSSRSAGRSSLKREMSSRTGKDASRNSELATAAAATAAASAALASAATEDLELDSKPEIATEDVMKSAPSLSAALPTAVREDKTLGAKSEAAPEEVVQSSAPPTELVESFAQSAADLPSAVSDDRESGPKSEVTMEKAVESSAPPSAPTSAEVPAAVADDTESSPKSEVAMEEAIESSAPATEEIVESSPPSSADLPAAVSYDEEPGAKPETATDEVVESTPPTSAESSAEVTEIKDSGVKTAIVSKAALASPSPSSAKPLPAASDDNEPVANPELVTEEVAESSPSSSEKGEPLPPLAPASSGEDITEAAPSGEDVLRIMEDTRMSVEMSEAAHGTEPREEPNSDGFGDDTPDDEDIMRMMESIRLSVQPLDQVPGTEPREEPNSDGFGDDTPDDEDIMRMMESIRLSVQASDQVPGTEPREEPNSDGLGDDTPDDDEIFRMMEEIRLLSEMSAPLAEMELTDNDFGEDEPDDEEIRKMMEEVNATMAEKQNTEDFAVPVEAELPPQSSTDAVAASDMVIAATGEATPNDAAQEPSVENENELTPSAPEGDVLQKAKDVDEADRKSSSPIPAVKEKVRALGSAEAGISESPEPATEQGVGAEAPKSLDIDSQVAQDVGSSSPEPTAKELVAEDTEAQEDDSLVAKEVEPTLATPEGDATATDEPNDATSDSEGDEEQQPSPATKETDSTATPELASTEEKKEAIEPPVPVVEDENEKSSPPAQKEQESSAENAPPAEGYYSLEDLQNNRYPEADVAHKEAYLSPEDFEKNFQMTKDEFDKLAKWKQGKAKQAAGLF
jgi:hypothetical protein